MEREKGEASNVEVPFSALRKDVANVLDFMESLKIEEIQKVVGVYRFELLKFNLTFICTYVQLSYSDLEQFEDIMTGKRKDIYNQLSIILAGVDNNVRCKYNMHHVFPSLIDNMNDCISSHHHVKSNATMMEEQLDFLLSNLHRLSRYCAEKMMSPLLVTQYEILQNVCGNVKDFHALIVNGFIKHEMVENVLPLFQLLAERVGHFLWEDLIPEETDTKLPVFRPYSLLLKSEEDDQTDTELPELAEDDQSDEESRLFKLAHLLLKIVPIELEVMQICHTNLKASTSAEVGRFIKRLLETSPDILRECLIHLQEHMVTVITAGTPGARNIHVMMEFLLIILTDMPGDLIHHDKLFDLLARVGVLTREVSTLVRGLEEKSMKNDSSNETNCATLDLQENIELLKKDLKQVYLKAPNSSQCCFPMSDGPLFMHLLHIHLNDLLDSNAYAVALIKEEIALVKQDLEFLRSFFVNVEQGLHKDLWARALDVAYEAKDVIDSIIVRDNGLLHLIFSLPITIKKIKLIKEEISNLLENIPKNKSLTAVNTPKKPVGSKSFTTGKIIVGFEEETNLIIRKLTSGPAYLDVISITGMPGSGKTTLAYKVYNDKRISSHFDLRAWCTVDQEHDEKKLLDTIFNQVNGSDSRLSENIDVADELRKQLYGKRYLIVLDDVWDTATWDELTRPFPEVVKGSRIILTTREKEVALHGKYNTDPLDLRLLRPEESWELLEKRAFGNESCPDDLLDVGKEIAQNCKGLPLVADLIAGVIAGREKKKTVWLEVLNNLNSFILNSEEEVMKVIELSYDHLPDQVKPCLLYLASWPKDSTVKTSQLIDYLRPEGLVEQTEMKVYLDDLISSSLVILFKEIGEYPTCRIHDLVHDFCLIKARKEKLFGQMSSIAPSSSSDLMSRIWIIHYNGEFFGLNNLVLFDSNKKRHSGKHLYSLRIDGNKLDDYLSDAFHLRHLRLLRALHLDPPFIMVKDPLLKEICMLNHLSFLHIGTKVKSLPAAFSNLWNLETLWLENGGTTTLVLLPRIWDLVKLRVLSIHDCCFFDLDADESIVIAEDTKLEKLRFLEKLVLSYSKDTEDIFKRFPNLQQLEFDLKKSSNYSAEQHWFPKLDFLTELEQLTVQFESSNTNESGSSPATNLSWDFHFPSNLKILKVVHFPLTSDALSTIVRLPNLAVLHLDNAIIQGGEWNMGEENTFENLKYLKLHRVTLSKWDVQEASFPMLEKLELRRCRMLEEIPPSFGDICSLKMIKLVESPQLVDSARKIKEYVEDMMGGDEFQVVGRKNIPLFH